MSVFRRKRQPAPTPSPARAALLAADAALSEGRLNLAEAEARVARLRAAVDAEAPARSALAAALSSGEQAAELVAGAQAAETAAKAAREALPRAEAEQSAAAAAVTDLEMAKQKAVAAVLIEEADALGRRYAAAFKKLVALHDELAGAAQAIDGLGPAITLASVASIELPRFRLPSQPQGFLTDERPADNGPFYTPFLKHVVYGATLAKYAATWRAAAATLAASPTAEIGPLVGADAVAAAAAEAPLALVPNVRTTPAPGDLPAGMRSVDEVLWGHDQNTVDRRRVHRLLGDAA
jgi:hypothetical protein